MNSLLYQDQAQRPELFVWNGPIPAERLDEWLSHRGLGIPEDLAQLWRETGGGDLFESETILSPLADDQKGNGVDEVNEFHQKRGLSSDYLIVQTGGYLTAIRLTDKKWVLLDLDSYNEINQFDSFDAWYRSVLRAEFAQRYKLPTSS